MGSLRVMAILKGSCSIACNSLAKSCNMVTVTTDQSLALLFRLVEGLVEVMVLDEDGFAASFFPLFRDFASFALPIGHLPFPPEVTLRPWGFALTLVFITTAGCCNVTLCFCSSYYCLQILILALVGSFEILLSI